MAAKRKQRHANPPADTTSRPGRWSWVAFNATVFVAAACIMTVEILSTRLVARFLGSSLYTWTSAIGVVLAGISLGNYVGGRLADRFIRGGRCRSCSSCLQSRASPSRS